MIKKKSLTNMQMFYQKLVLFIKKYWGYFLAASGVFIAILLFKKDRSSLLEQMQSIRDSYEQQLKKIEEVRDRKSTRLNSSHVSESRMPSSA